MVSFTENPENYDSLAMVEYIDEQIAECMTLERKLSALDRDLAVDPRYVHRVSSLCLHMYMFYIRGCDVCVCVCVCACVCVCVCACVCVCWVCALQSTSAGETDPFLYDEAVM